VQNSGWLEKRLGDTNRCYNYTDLRGRGAASAGAGEVNGSPLRGGGGGGKNTRRRGLEEDGETDLLGVEQGPAARGLDHAAEVAVVPVVGGVLNAQVVATQRREPLHPVQRGIKLYEPLIRIIKEKII
jgi:hypothetical protein